MLLKPGEEVAFVEEEPTARPGMTARARAERRLGLILKAPSALVMLVVAGYPIVYALWISLSRHDLRFPNASHFVGVSNYAAVLTSPTRNALVNTVVITVASVAVELVRGFALALVMPRALFGRAIVRSAVLVPYAIITVVAALAWRFAFPARIPRQEAVLAVALSIAFFPAISIIGPRSACGGASGSSTRGRA